MKPTRVNDKHFVDISWHEDAEKYAEMYGLSREDCEKIVLSRSRPEVDVRSHELGHLIMRYRAGDVTIVVGHRDKRHPVIMSVWVNTKKQRAGSQKNSGTKGSSLPNSMKELNRRILADGFKIKQGGSHMRVEDDEGRMICTLPSTPSEYRTIANVWKKYQHAKAEYHQNRKAEQ